MSQRSAGMSCFHGRKVVARVSPGCRQVDARLSLGCRQGAARVSPGCRQGVARVTFLHPCDF